METKSNIEALVKELSDALVEAYANTGNNRYFQAATAMGGVDSQVWMAHNLSRKAA